MADPKPLNRAQLAKFLPDQESIRRFEKMFAIIEPLTPDSVSELLLLIASADSKAVAASGLALQAMHETALGSEEKANMALSLLERIAHALELLALAPTVQIGTMGQQQADHVAITGGSVAAELSNNQTILLASTATLTDGAAAALGTLTNAPSVGDPTKWVTIDDNGVLRHIPSW